MYLKNAAIKSNVYKWYGNYFYSVLFTRSKSFYAGQGQSLPNFTLQCTLSMG